MSTQSESYGITPEELNQARAACNTIRRMSSVSGADAASVIDKAIAAIVEEGERADKAEAELKIHQHWHDEAIKLQGPEPGRTPSMVNAWIRNLMSRLDASEARVKELETQLLIIDEFGDPLENAMDRIKELLSMFNCQSCYDKRWVVGVEGADPCGGDPGNECQIPCPDCNLPTPKATP